MAHMSTPPLVPVPVEVKARRWTLRVIAILLVAQAGFLLGTSAVYLSHYGWNPIGASLWIAERVLDSLLLTALLTPLALFEIWTAIGMWIGRRNAWLRALIVQGILLIFSLSSYVAQRQMRFIYVLMLSCIIIVLYLNANDVRITYQSTTGQRRPRTRQA